MNKEKIIEKWIAASNSCDTVKYLSFYVDDAVLDDVSVGRKFIGKKGILEYFESYFIGYKTKTKIVDIIIKDENSVHVEVEFAGDFAEGKLGGTFDLTFKDGNITFLLADLIL